jgi:hypothetical protein
VQSERQNVADQSSESTFIRLPMASTAVERILAPRSPFSLNSNSNSFGKAALDGFYQQKAMTHASSPSGLELAELALSGAGGGSASHATRLRGQPRPALLITNYDLKIA